MHTLKILFVLLFTAVIFSACSSDVDNSISFTNESAGTLFINFRAEIITVAPGEKTVISEIPRGTYNYSTTYEIPALATQSDAQGAVAGDLSINAGTKILILYSSTFSEEKYTLYATISNSDDKNAEDPFAP